MHGQRTAWWKRWDMTYVVGKAWILKRGDAFLCSPLCQKEIRPITELEHRGLGYVTPSAQSESGTEESPPSHSSDSSSCESDINMWVVFKNLFANVTSISQVEQDGDVELFDADSWAQQLWPPMEKAFRATRTSHRRQRNPSWCKRSRESKAYFHKWKLIANSKERLYIFYTRIYRCIRMVLWRHACSRLSGGHALSKHQTGRQADQATTTVSPDIMDAIEIEVHKLIECGFIWEDQHPDWVTNIVPVLKKNGKIRVYIDFHDLNTSTKDKFSLLITDIMIDNTCGFERISFMDGFSRYNQIKMYPDDEKHTSFRTLCTLHSNSILLEKCWCNLPTCNRHNFPWSRTKNGGMLCCDITVKSRIKDNHLHDLRMVFDIMWAHQLKMNLTKSFLGVSSGKIFGFIVTSKEIHLDPNKINVIQGM